MEKLADKIAENKEQKEIIKAKKIKRAKQIGVMALFILLVIFFLGCINSYVKWSRENTIFIQSPITIQKQKMVEIVSLAEVRRRESEKAMIDHLTEIVFGIVLKPSENTVAKLKESIPKNIDAKEFFNIIWKHESSNGKDTTAGALHMYCRNLGMWNEIGYNPQAKFCFKDKQEAELFINYYVYKNGQEKTMSQLLCFYNSGKASDTCAYSEGNLSEAN